MLKTHLMCVLSGMMKYLMIVAVYVLMFRQNSIPITSSPMCVRFYLHLHCLPYHKLRLDSNIE